MQVETLKLRVETLKLRVASSNLTARCDLKHWNCKWRVETLELRVASWNLHVGLYELQVKPMGLKWVEVLKIFKEGVKKMSKK